MADVVSDKWETLKNALSDMGEEEIDVILNSGLAEVLGIPPITMNEAGLVNIMKLLIAQGEFESTFGLTPAAKIEWEYPVPRGRADFVVFHVDGSITVIEVKGNVDDRGLINSVGQVMSYATQIGYSRAAKKIRMMVIVAKTAADVIHLKPLFETANIQLVPAGALSKHREETAGIVMDAIGQLVKRVVDGRQ